MDLTLGAILYILNGLAINLALGEYSREIVWMDV